MIWTNYAVTFKLKSEKVPLVFLDNFFANQNSNYCYKLVQVSKAQAINVAQQSHYTTQPKGHAPNNLPYYARFTSPLWRYQDRLNQRLLLSWLLNSAYPSQEVLNKACELFNEKELNIKRKRSSILAKQETALTSSKRNGFKNPQTPQERPFKNKKVGTYLMMGNNLRVGKK